MKRAGLIPSIVVHGGAGGGGSVSERPERRRAILNAARHGAGILRGGGSALEAVVGAVTILEDHPLFNAGYGSVLNTDGAVEMDAAVAVCSTAGRARDCGRAAAAHAAFASGAVAAISRVRNPIALARAVMERSPHLLLVAGGAERFAAEVGIELCRPSDMITTRSRRRWRQRRKAVRVRPRATSGHGTVGAVAIDVEARIAAATSTGGVPGKLPGRVGDSAIIGAGVFAGPAGGASATGHGEAIIRSDLCRRAVADLGGRAPSLAARRAISDLIAPLGAEAGIILVDRRGRIGFAHNAAAMEVASYDPVSGLHHTRVAGRHRGAA